MKNMNHIQLQIYIRATAAVFGYIHKQMIIFLCLIVSYYNLKLLQY